MASKTEVNMAVGLEELPAFWTLHQAQKRRRFFYGRGLALAVDWHLTSYFLFLHLLQKVSTWSMSSIMLTTSSG